MSNATLQPHIRCSEKDAALYAVLPGDPARVDRVAQHLTNVTQIAYNREMKTVTGFYQGIKIIVTSTGMGGASTGIAVEELRNIGVTHMIRIGSCGALQSGLKLGDLVIASGAVRDDGASQSYARKAYPAVPNSDMLFAAVQSASQLAINHHVGIARSHDSFYIDNQAEVDDYWSSKGVLAADMETAALFTIGGLRGVKTASILNVVVLKEGTTAQGINDYVDMEADCTQGETNEILLALQTIKTMHDQNQQK